MNLIYLKSKDAHVNLDLVETVQHDFDKRRDADGNEVTLTSIHFATNSEHDDRVVIVTDPEDRDYLRRRLELLRWGME